MRHHSIKNKDPLLAALKIINKLILSERYNYTFRLLT